MFCLFCSAIRSLTNLLCFFKSHALFELYQASRHINCKAFLAGGKSSPYFLWLTGYAHNQFERQAGYVQIWQAFEHSRGWDTISRYARCYPRSLTQGSSLQTALLLMTHLNNGAKKGVRCLFAILAQQEAGQWEMLHACCRSQFDYQQRYLLESCHMTDLLPVTHLNNEAKKSSCLLIAVELLACQACVLSAMFW